MNSLVLLALLVQASADTAHEKARQKLEASDAAGAEAAARAALALSLNFRPELELELPPKGLLFEDMIQEARETYRERRAAYFRTLGNALAAQEEWRASRKAYRRAAKMQSDPEIFLLMADDEDLDSGERVALVLDAYLSPGADRIGLEERLLESGLFRSRNALKASLDARRFPELQSKFPDLELLPGAFPSFQVVTDAGNLKTGELYALGGRLLVYVPVEGCGYCSEQLDGLTVPVVEARKRDAPFFVAAFVPELELPNTRRIVRLLAMEVGVGRLAGLPPSVGFYGDGEIRVVARGGMTQIRIPMYPDLRASEIRRRVEAIFQFLDDPDLLTEEKPEQASVPIVTLERQVNEQRALYEWIDQLEKLEAGPAPLDDLYEQLRRLAQRIARGSRSRDLGFEVMAALGKLEGASASKTRTLALLGTDIGDRILEEVQKIDASVRRTAPSGRGSSFVHVTESKPRQVLLQRPFQTSDGLRHFNIVLEDDGQDLKLVFLAPEDDIPRGVEAVGADDDAAFYYATGEDCSGLRLVRGGEVVYENCAAAVLDGELVEVRSALVDPFPDGPVYFRRNVLFEHEDTALERGLQLFELGDFGGAVAAFEEAAENIDPVAPYDASDLVYNTARSLEAQGKRREALALYRSLGDVGYQSLVDEGAGRIEGAPR